MARKKRPQTEDPRLDIASKINTAKKLILSSNTQTLKLVTQIELQYQALLVILECERELIEMGADQALEDKLSRAYELLHEFSIQALQKAWTPHPIQSHDALLKSIILLFKAITWAPHLNRLKRIGKIEWIFYTLSANGYQNVSPEPLPSWLIASSILVIDYNIVEGSINKALIFFKFSTENLGISESLIHKDMRERLRLYERKPPMIATALRDLAPPPPRPRPPSPVEGFHVSDWEPEESKKPSP